MYSALFTHCLAASFGFIPYFKGANKLNYWHLSLDKITPSLSMAPTLVSPRGSAILPTSWTLPRAKALCSQQIGLDSEVIKVLNEELSEL